MVRKVKGNFERSIIVGSISHWLGKKADGHTHTHKWSAYIRGINNEELPFIKKVVFHLHASFKNPNRAVESPPFEMSETGWGEFDLGVTLYFADPAEKPLDLFHLLRLHPPDGIKTKQPVVSETLDVILFRDPTESFYQLIKLPEKPPEQSNHALKLTEQKLTLQEQTEINKLVDSRTKIIGQVQKYRDQAKSEDNDALQLYQQVQQLERKKLIYQKKMEKYNQMKQQQQQIVDIGGNGVVMTKATSTTTTPMDITHSNTTII
ncbi:hypothetical protein SAMD00019534_107470 [Acytostelium subglobosum LB1]|uniref:hypothetical protein n=1 Tax=Acytostelium subglobosum LB1 TaxID=1410327 RepID=UPI00064512FD|nr:hypothetical protein SAMD00019534_107470 [Acytostelium subglobosum LB1]GAM27571.1 hypothetical protein SAMD00019534_107470 [Acytostelium subglobosum LB1]|eukprot:XP_012749636.1 hypothetical protein SAMD00019534_107470 [Acytostelium subglobosum LB1]